MQFTAVITGGSKGIGLAIAKKFLDNGFRVIQVSRSPSGINSKSLIEISADLSVKEENKRVVNEITKVCDRLDVLVNNAGIFVPGAMQNEEDEVFEKVMALNIYSGYYISKGLIPLMKHDDTPYIFNICSTASLKAYPGGGSYCISKHAMLGLSRVLREELKNDKIAVSSIFPGATLTDSWKNSGHPDSRFMKAETLASYIWNAWEHRSQSVMEEILIRPLLGDI